MTCTFPPCDARRGVSPGKEVNIPMKKQTFLQPTRFRMVLGIVVLLLLSAPGCVCWPGYCGPGYSGPGYGGGACPPGMLGCGSLLNPGGVVDYVDGTPGADCGTNCAPNTGIFGGSPCVAHGVPHCTSCLGRVVNGVYALGEGALTLAASPFILLGSLISGGPCGYETYPNCGCSNEIYYGDNCYQPHDFNDPCTGCGGQPAANSGCANCGGGYAEGIPYNGNVKLTKSDSGSGVSETPSPTVRPTPISPPVQTGFRPVQQTSFRQPTRMPTQRVTPPRPVSIPSNYQKKALPVR